MNNTVSLENPFKGPKPYEEGEILYGREKETFELINLIENNTLTLLYSKSGIGKSSLINASLVPMLRDTKRYLPLVFRLGSFVNYQSVNGFSEYLIAEISGFMSSKYGIEVQQPTIPGSLFEFLYLMNSNGELKIKSEGKEGKDGQEAKYLIPIIILDQLEVIFTLELERGNLEHLIEELKHIIEGEYPDYLIERYSPTTAEKKYNEIQSSIDSKIKPFRFLFSFREEYLFDFENFSDRIPSIRFSSSRYRLSPFSRAVAQRVIKSASNGLIPDDQGNNIIDSLLPERKGNFKVEEVDPFLLSLTCNQVWKSIVEEKITINRNIIDNVIDNYISRVYGTISPSAKKFIETNLITTDNKRTLFSFQLATFWNMIGSDELAALINKPELRLLNREMYLESYHVQLLHDRLVPPISKRKKEREDAEKRQKEADLKREQAEKEALLIQEQERIRSEKERELREQFERKELQQKAAFDTFRNRRNRAAIFALGLALIALIVYVWMVVRESRKNDMSVKALALIDAGDMQVFESDYEKRKEEMGNQTFKTTGDPLTTAGYDQLLKDAIIRYDSALKLYPEFKGTSERLIQANFKLISNIDRRKSNSATLRKSFYDRIIFVYEQSLIKNSQSSVLFNVIVSKLDEVKDNSNYTDSVVAKLLSLDRIHLKLDEKYYRQRTSELFAYNYDSLALIQLKSIKTNKLTDSDFLLMSLLNYDEPLPPLWQCIKRYPASCNCLLELGDNYSTPGEKDSSVFYYRKSFDSSGEGTACKKSATQRLITKYYRSKNDREIVRMFDYVIKFSDSTDYNLLNLYAWQLAMESKFLDYAESISNLSLKYNPYSGYCWDTLAEIYKREGKLDKAEGANNNAIKYGASPGLTKARSKSIDSLRQLNGGRGRKL